MVDDHPYTSRRTVLASSALLFSGCMARLSTEGEPEEPGDGTAGNEEADGSSGSSAEGSTDGRDDDSSDSDGSNESDESDAPDVDDRTADVDPDVDPSYRGSYVRDGRQVDNFELLDHWTVAEGGEVGIDESYRFAGTQSLSYEGTGRTVLVGDYRGDPLDLTDADLSIAANFREGTDEVWKVQVFGEAPDSDNELVWELPYLGKDVEWQRLNLAPIGAKGDPDPSDVRRLKVVASPSDDRTTLGFNLDDLRAHPKPERGKIVFRFDGCYAVHHEDYFPVLQDHGYPAMEAVSKGSVSVDYEDRLSVQQLYDLDDAGWDLCNRLTSEWDVTEMSEAELRRDVEEMNDWFDGYDFENDGDLFVYPTRTYDGESLAVLDDYFDLAFAVGPLDTTNYSLTNPLTVNSFPARYGIEETKAVIDRVANFRSVGVLMFHDEYSREEFEEVVRYVADNDDRLDVVAGRDLADHVRSRA